MKARLLWLLLLVLMLTGCSGMRIVDSDVQAYATAPAISMPASYRFERLPSQMNRVDQTNALEAVVQEKLSQLGMHRDAGAAQYSVRVELRVNRDARAPWDEARYSAGFFAGFPIVTRRGAVYLSAPIFPAMQMPWYRREISLLIRRLADGALVYETRARSDGNWSDDTAVVPAMLTAALLDFPHPAPGPRRVSIDIPR